MRNRQAVTWGIVLGLYCHLFLAILRGGLDDYTNVFRPAILAGEPYADGLLYWYPPWNTVVLQLLPETVALAIIWGFSILVVLVLSKQWNTPPWIVLLSPVFLNAMVVACPFEALFFLGISLTLSGSGVGLGLCLVMFKPQLALLVVPLVIVRKGLKSLGWPLWMVAVVTCVDYLVTGRFWLIPWWENLQRVDVGSAYNVALWPALGVLSLLWVPLGAWLFVRAQGNFRRELWLATAGSLLFSPYWAAYSLWPLVAMVGGLMGNANSKCERRITCQDYQLG